MALSLPTTGSTFVIEDQPDTTELLSALLKSRKSTPPKFLYDDKGSHLFNEICKLEEYYQTRTEISILNECAGDIAWIVGSRCLILEYGSGTSEKTNVLLSKLHHPAGYVAIDISRDALDKAAHRLSHDFPALPIFQVNTDFMSDVSMPIFPPHFRSNRCVGFFPGSTIGNLEPQQAIAFLKRNRQFLGDKNYFIVGVDLIKDVAVLEAAYNDSKGVTAAFNLNLIHRINKDLGTSFDLHDFEHRAFFNLDFSRIEMHLVAKRELSQKTSSTTNQQTIKFKAGETIHTENSYKYTLDSFKRIAQAAGYEVNRQWLDNEERFAVVCLKSP